MSVRPVDIRRGVLGDLAAMVALDRSSESAPHWSEQAYRVALLGQDGRCLFVADDSGVCGFVVGSVVAGAAELESVVVTMERRRRGLGRQLVKAVMAWARTAAAQSISLEVRASSLGAIALYQSLGFRAVARRKGYYAMPTEDALIMRQEWAEPTQYRAQPQPRLH